MTETCGREKAAVIPHAYQDEPGLVARAITLIKKEMMEEIFNERLRDKKGMITVYEEFQEEIMKYEQRKRAVSRTPRAHPLHQQPAPRHQPAQVEVWGSWARAGRSGLRRSSPACDGSWAWRRRPGSHSSSSARRSPHSGPRCGWSVEICQGHHATPAMENPSL